MKKIIFSMMALALTATAFTGCEDVPAPYSMNFDDSNVTPTPKPAADPKGSGTEADPFNVAAALKYIEAGQNLDKQVYVSGTIVSVKEIDATNYGNATYYISDDGTASGQLTVYRGYDLGNKKFTAADRLKAGDKVVVYGKLVNFNGTKEFTQGNYIYSLNGKKAEDTPAADLNTEATAWTVAEAVQKIQAGQTAGGEAYVKGIISAVTYYDAAHKSLTYYLSDNGTDKVLQVFSGKGLNGADFAAKTDLQAGQTVVVKGNLKSFTNKKGQVVMEVDKGSKIVSISGTPSPQPSVAALTAKFDAGMDNFTVNDISLPSQLTYIWKHDASRKYMKATSHKGTSDYAAQSRLESSRLSSVLPAGPPQRSHSWSLATTSQMPPAALRYRFLPTERPGMMSPCRPILLRTGSLLPPPVTSRHMPASLPSASASFTPAMVSMPQVHGKSRTWK